MPLVSSCRRVTLVIAATVVAIGATAGPALAGGAPAACPSAPVSNPFARWGDLADYSLAPEGDVESTASWSLSGGAAAVEGNETFMVTRATDHRSMRLPASGSATTPRMCLGVGHPTFRFFAKRSGGTSISRLIVEVVFDDRGRELALPVGLIAAPDADTWAPSVSLPTLADRLAPLLGTAIRMSFRFTPVAGGVWSVDDVYVDPHRIG
jgi:hypothetical protein